MTKQIKEKVKLMVPAGAATPAPPVGNTLGQRQVNIMEFCKQFNAATQGLKGQTVNVEITIYTDKSFSFVLKTPPTSDLIRKHAGVTKGASKPNEPVGKITKKAVEEIAKIKLPDLNAVDLDAAKRSVEGSARSMGIKVVD